MTVCMFLTYQSASEGVPDVDSAWMAELAKRIQSISGLARAVMHTPGSTSDPYLRDQDLPALVVQLYFSGLHELEAQLQPSGAIHDLVNARWAMTQQVMLVRNFAVPVARSASEQVTYLVAYHGAALDYSTWLTHYVTHHIPLMLRLPGLRALEIYTRLDWASSLPIPRSNAVQRNKVVFDDATAMTAALNSPLRHEMRKDYQAFPPFEGANQHYPMISRQLD